MMEEEAVITAEEITITMVVVIGIEVIVIGIAIIDGTTGIGLMAFTGTPLITQGITHITTIISNQDRITMIMVEAFIITIK
jgi:hypothetical protein